MCICVCMFLEYVACLLREHALLYFCAVTTRNKYVPLTWDIFIKFTEKYNETVGLFCLYMHTVLNILLPQIPFLWLSLFLFQICTPFTLFWLNFVGI